MKRLIKKFRGIKGVGKYILGIFGVAALLSQLIGPTSSMRADGPRFNFMQGDAEIMRGYNITKNEDVWKNPVTNIDAGDVVQGTIYYHNGMVDTVAENTKVKITVPEESTNGSAKVTAKIWADNAVPVTSTIVDGVLYGRDGLILNFNQDVNLSFVPGSVRWYPDKQSRGDTPMTLPSGQSGNEIVSANGVNIGDIKGCWEHAGYINFAIKATAKATPDNLTIKKSVRNISKNQDTFVDSVTADQGEKVEFKIDYSNTGGTAAAKVIASDVMPSELSLIAGSARLVKNGASNPIPEANFFANGITIGDVSAGSNDTSIYYSATVPAQITVGKTLINTAKASYGSKNLSDTANVVLNPGSVNIIRSKSAWNQTQNVDATTVVARPSDTIEYTLKTKNSGNLSTVEDINDGVADILEYADVVSISDGGSLIDGTKGTNDAKMVHWKGVSLEPGKEIVRKFTVRIKSALSTSPASGFHYDGVIFNRYGNDVSIRVEEKKFPILKINKLVRNVTRNDLEYTEADTANSGDTIEYKIDFENVGNAPADYAIMKDALPNGVSLDPNAPAILGIGGKEATISENITSGYTIKTINPGEKGYIRFRAKTASGIAGGEKLVNTAYLADDGATISDTAETIVLEKVVTASATKSVPKTGAAVALFSLMISGFTTVNVAYLRQKKALFDAARRIRIA